MTVQLHLINQLLDKQNDIWASASKAVPQHREHDKQEKNILPSEHAAMEQMLHLRDNFSLILQMHARKHRPVI